MVAGVVSRGRRGTWVSKGVDNSVVQQRKVTLAGDGDWEKREDKGGKERE